MKTRILMTILAIFFVFANGYSQEKKSKKSKKVETVEIQTSAICGMCKKKLEHDIAFEKGVRSVELNDETKVLTVTYKEGKNSKENIKKAITQAGYDADDMPADIKAYNNLPACCKKDNEPH